MSEPHIQAAKQAMSLWRREDSQKRKQLFTKMVDLTLQGATFHLDSFEDVGWLRSYVGDDTTLLLEWDEVDCFPYNPDEPLTLEQALDSVKQLWQFSRWCWQP